MRPFVTALACVALLFVATATNAQDFGQGVYNQAVSAAQEAGADVQATAETIPQLCAEAAEADVCPEVVNRLYSEFMGLGQTFMVGMQIIGEAEVEATLAETDAEYLDATKKVLLGKRAFDRVSAELSRITETLEDETEKAGAPPEA